MENFSFLNKTWKTCLPLCSVEIKKTRKKEQRPGKESEVSL